MTMRTAHMETEAINDLITDGADGRRRSGPSYLVQDGCRGGARCGGGGDGRYCRFDGGG